MKIANLFNIFVNLSILGIANGYIRFPKSIYTHCDFDKSIIKSTSSLQEMSTKLFSSKSQSIIDNSIKDLTGHSLWVTFTGFNMENMTFAMELQPNNKVLYTSGITALDLGFWRTFKIPSDNNKFVFEATHPVLPEYAYFFELSENTILWRGEYDVQSNKVLNGEVLTNKKRLGLFPYTETLATFSADVYGPDEKYPEVYIPTIEEQCFDPPSDFLSPYDMKRYPQYFDQEFVDWFFDVEDAIANNQEPPPRPKPFFAPRPITDNETKEEDKVSGKSFRKRN